MYEAFLIQAKKFEKDFNELCLDQEKEQAKKYLECQKQYYLQVREASLCIQAQMKSCLAVILNEQKKDSFPSS